MDFGQLAMYLNYTLTWIGFGTVLGLMAKVAMPGRDHGISTVIMGIAGTLLGCLILQYFAGDRIILPISPQGFAIGAGGAVVLLIFYKVLGGYWFLEGEHTLLHQRRLRRKRYESLVED